MDTLYIPVLHSFAMNNVFTGSKGSFRFRIKPVVVKKEKSKEVDFEASSIHCEYWHGPYCYEKSQMEGSRIFPMTQEGVDEMKAWLIDHI